MIATCTGMKVLQNRLPFKLAVVLFTYILEIPIGLSMNFFVLSVDLEQHSFKLPLQEMLALNLQFLSCFQI